MNHEVTHPLPFSCKPLYRGWQRYEKLCTRVSKEDDFERVAPSLRFRTACLYHLQQLNQRAVSGTQISAN